MNHRQEIALRIRDYQLRSVAHGGDSARDFRFQCFKTSAVARGDQNRIRWLDDGIRLYAVGLVKHLENRAVGGAEVVQNLEYRIALLGVIRAGQVGHDDQEIGVNCFFQRGAECLNQRMRQLSDESDGIDQQAAAVFREIDIAHNGVQCCEELVLDQHVRAGKRVQERGFARVGIADERNDGLPLLFAAGAAEIAALFDFLQIAFEIINALADAAAIHFELRFAGAARADAAAETGKLRALTGKTRKAIFHLCKLDLQFALGRLRVLGENIENQRGAIDHANAERVFKIALLRAGKLVVKDCEIDFQCLTRK